MLWLFLRWLSRLDRAGKEPLVDPALLRVRQLTGGLVMFFLQFLLQMGIFFIVPLFLSVVLGMTAIADGRAPAAALGRPAARRGRRPEAVAQGQPAACVPGRTPLLPGRHLLLLGGIDLDANARIVAIPMLLIGFGIGAMASQLGAVTVSAVPDEKSPEVGGLQNTMTNLGLSLSTALVGSIMIAVLTSSFITDIQNNPERAAKVKHRRTSSWPPVSRSCPTPTSRRR